MKSLIQAIALVVTLAVPVASFAQSTSPVTRAEVRTELAQLEKAGYNPARSNPNTWGDDLRVAEARVAAQTTVTASVSHQ